jgi:hypothetical protein
MNGLRGAAHDAYGMPRELFGQFFPVIAGTMREILGADWTLQIDGAWQRLPSSRSGQADLRQLNFILVLIDGNIPPLPIGQCRGAL